jgi:mycothiol synthase
MTHFMPAYWALRSMNEATLRIRNYQPADFRQYVLLQAEAEEAEPTGRCVSPQFIAEQLRRPNYSPGHDLFICEIDKGIAGYVDIEPELAIERVVLDCRVHPEHRRKGVATALFNRATNRIKDLGVKVAHVNIRQDNSVARKILTELGFIPVRQFLELRLDIGRVEGLDIHTSVQWHYLQAGQEDDLTKLQNRAFVGTWGYNSNTVETMTFRINLSTRSRQDIVLAYDEDRIVGYCWTGISCEEGIPSVRRGRIHMLGVDPDRRRKGIGRELMKAGLTHLKNRGLKTAELTVDGENEAACALYQGLGFELQARTLWYEKSVS